MYEDLACSLVTVSTLAAPVLAEAKARVQAALEADAELDRHTTSIHVRAEVTDLGTVWGAMQSKGLTSVEQMGDLDNLLVLSLALESSPESRTPARWGHTFNEQAHQARLRVRALSTVNSALKQERCRTGAPRGQGAVLRSLAFFGGWKVEVQVVTVGVFECGGRGQQRHGRPGGGRMRFPRQHRQGAIHSTHGRKDTVK